MPQLIIDIKTPEAAQAVADAICDLYDYEGEDTPQVRWEFVRQKIAWWLREKVKEHRQRQAEQAARAQPEPDIE